MNCPTNSEGNAVPKRETTHKGGDDQAKCAHCLRLRSRRLLETYCETTDTGVPLRTPVLVCKDLRGCLNVTRDMLPF